MGRPTEGWYLTWKRGWAYCRFTWQGTDVRLALRTRDKRQAQEAAARAYADVVSGRRRPLKRRPGHVLGLEELLDAWIESKKPSLDPRTLESIEAYAARYLDSFQHLDRITEASGANFGMARLGQVLRTTALRELAYLREFLRWCKQQQVVAEVPHIPRLPAKAQGKRSGPQRAKSVHISPTEAALILADLPPLSKTIGGRKWPIRDRFRFAWETALRPETISRLSVPDNWRPGMKHVELTNEDDKARWGREIDLTPIALGILEAVNPGDGLLFGDHCYYKVIKRVAIAVLGPIRGKSFAPYDFRHGRAKALLDAGAPIRGVSYILGHKRVSTTDKYLAPERSAGLAALAAAAKTVSAPNPPPTKHRRRKDA